MPAWLYLTILVARLAAWGWLINRTVVASRLPPPLPRHAVPAAPAGGIGGAGEVRVEADDRAEAEAEAEDRAAPEPETAVPTAS
jgi:hypothetical protein